MHANAQSKDIPGDGFMQSWRRELNSAPSVNGFDCLSSSVDSHVEPLSCLYEGAPATQQVEFGSHARIQLKCKFSLS